MVRDDGRQLAEMVVQRGTWDVLGGAMASDGRDVTVTIRLRSVPAASPEPQELPASDGIARTTGRRALLEQPRVVRTASGFRLTAPFAGFLTTSTVQRGSEASELAAATHAAGVPVDAAVAERKPYILGARSCLNAG